MDWNGVDYLWIIVMFLSDVWTLILTAPIHCRASIAETFLQIWWRNKLILILNGLRISIHFQQRKVRIWEVSHPGLEGLWTAWANALSEREASDSQLLCVGVSLRSAESADVLLFRQRCDKRLHRKCHGFKFSLNARPEILKRIYLFTQPCVCVCLGRELLEVSSEGVDQSL